MDIRNFFFRYRSFTPIPLGLMIIYFARPESSHTALGGTLLALGEMVRMWAVSYAGGQTRTRKVGASALCSSGPYSFVRNPLYVGNMMMYAGIVLIAGAANIILMVATTVSFFLIQYSLIISLEEETLEGLFKESYVEYKNNVPAIFPRITKWKNNDSRQPASLIKTVKTEKRTLQNVLFILILILLRVQVFS